MKKFLTFLTLPAVLLALTPSVQAETIYDDFVNGTLTEEQVREEILNINPKGEYNFDIEGYYHYRPFYGVNKEEIEMMYNASVLIDLTDSENPKFAIRLKGNGNIDKYWGDYDIEVKLIDWTMYAKPHDYPLEYENRYFIQNHRNTWFTEESRYTYLLPKLYRDTFPLLSTVSKILLNFEQLVEKTSFYEKMTRILNSEEIRKHIEIDEQTEPGKKCIRLEWNSYELADITDMVANEFNINITHEILETIRERNENWFAGVCRDPNTNELIDYYISPRFLTDINEYNTYTRITPNRQNISVNLSKPTENLYSLRYSHESISDSIWDIFRLEYFEKRNLFEFIEEISLVIDTYVFSDISYHTFREDILIMHHFGYINGYQDGNFGPDDNLTRGQAFAIIHRTFELDTNLGCENFPDNPTDGTFYKETHSLKCAGIIQGDKGQAKLNENITRGQVTHILIEALSQAEINTDINDEIIENGTIGFSDVAIEHTFWVSITWAELYEIVNGYPDDTFRPDESVTRGQFAAMANRARKL